jgi:hypothetical protein
MSAPFAAKERVLCYHGPLIYEAKVLEVKHFDGTDGPSGQPGWGFYVHYKGWKQKCVHALFAHASGGSALRRVRRLRAPRAPPSVRRVLRLRRCALRLLFAARSVYCITPFPCSPVLNSSTDASRAPGGTNGSTRAAC